MIPVLVVGMFIGYTLVYAAVVEGGKYATKPWDTLLPASAGGPAAPVHYDRTGRILAVMAPRFPNPRQAGHLHERPT